ncbi:MAG: hypothetical protein INQ03_09915 [Candidatus Heimdallarchaeota archaeon]|nr:hypothetical protein [Candidatus Heimdallarchaeota archaeon]
MTREPKQLDINEINGPPLPKYYEVNPLVFFFVIILFALFLIIFLGIADDLLLEWGGQD